MKSKAAEVSIRIKKRMKEVGLKQADIVKLSGVSKGAVSKWLAGTTKPLVNPFKMGQQKLTQSK